MKVHRQRRRVSTACANAESLPAPEVHEASPGWTLRPPPQTRRDEFCRCIDAPPIKLVGGAGFNPIHCLECGSEVDFRLLGLRQDLLDDIERWRCIAGGIYDLWYWSDQYDEWAEEQLCDPDSPVNALGRAVQRRVDRVRRCYYEFFADEIVWEPGTPKACPGCGADLTLHPTGPLPQGACHPCSIVLSWLPEEEDPD